MFERYTDGARRALFFARFEVTQLGGQSIDTEHLLLGVLRLAHGLVNVALGDLGVSVMELRREATTRAQSSPKPLSHEIPFSSDVVRVLQGAAHEADQMEDKEIGPEHLLLALADTHGTAAHSILEHVKPEDLRRRVIELRLELHRLRDDPILE